MSHESFPDTHHDLYSKTVFGFWIYLITDFMLFATLFAAYAVLRNSTYGGPSGQELFNLPLALIQTLIALTSSLCAGLGGACAHRKNKQGTLIFFTLTFLLGITFLAIGLTEFADLLRAGHTWKKSAFLSIFFSLVGMHGIHVLFALFWCPILLFPVMREGITSISIRRLTTLRMFWQFVNIIWVLIFTIVFMGGVR